MRTEIINKIKTLKDELLNEIISSDEPIYKKVQLIDENDLFKIASWIQRPFKDIQKSLNVELLKDKKEGEYICTIFDDWFTMGYDRDRGSIVSFGDTLEEMNEYPDDYTDDEGLIVVLRRRGNSPVEYKMTVEEFTNHMWKWALENKTTQWYFDW
jgi:hypothetical protein